MPSKKANLKDYIETVQSIKPSAEVKFGRANKDGETIVESVASKEYEAIVNSEEVQEAAEESTAEEVAVEEPAVEEMTEEATPEETVDSEDSSEEK